MNDSAHTEVSQRALPDIPGRSTLRFLGKGGMAEVYLALDEFLDRRVAIKVISKKLASDDEFVQRFEDEAKTVAGFEHSNIVTVYQYGTLEDRPFIEMAYERGGSLADKIRAGVLPPDRVMDVAVKTLSALAYSHERGIIHRDVTPGNILFSATDEPILSDFGIAKAIDTSEHRTKTGLQIGSPRYMSPEQLRGERVTDKTDVFSMALVVHEMLTGALPNRSLCSIRNARDKREFEKSLRLRNPKLSLFLDYFSASFRDDPTERASAAECVGVMQDIIAAANPDWRGRGLAAALGIGITLAATGLIYQYVVSPTAQLTLAVNPAQAEVRVDGDLIEARELQINKGRSYEVMVTADGYVGDIWRLNLQTDSRQDLMLEQLALPGKAEHFAFDRQFFEDTAADSDPDIEYPLYRELIAIKRLQESDRYEFRRRIRDIETLANRNDPSAQLGLFLLVYAGISPLRDEIALKMLQASAESGYGLASYFNAARFATEFVDESGGLTPTEARRYIGFLEDAFNQGLGWAEEAMLIAEESLQNATDS